MTRKKIAIITASVAIPVAIFGILILAYPHQIPNEGYSFDMWSFEYEDTRESFPTESLGQKICDITYRCEVPIQVNTLFYDDLIAIYERAPQSTLENFYGEKISTNTVYIEVVGTWNDEADRLKIKQFIEEISGVYDVQFKGSKVF